MKSAFLKELWRTIIRKPGRFLALFGIIALGAGFYAGLRMTCPDMKLAVDHYLDATHSYDLRIVGTMGLSDADGLALEELDAVQDVMMSKQTDVLALFGEEEQRIDAEIGDIVFKRTELFNLKQTFDPSKERDRVKETAREIDRLDAQIKKMQKDKADRVASLKREAQADAAYQKHYTDTMAALKARYAQEIAKAAPREAKTLTVLAPVTMPTASPRATWLNVFMMV